MANVQPTELWSYVRNEMPKIPRFAVEFGALDGQINSNIRVFLEDGWRGLWIEPSKENYARLEKNIEGLDVEIMNIAVADFDGEQTFYFHKGCPGHSSLVNPSDISYPVPCRRLVTILKDCPAVGLMTIDAEDMDTRILADMIATNVRPHLVMSEGRNKQTMADQQRVMSCCYDLVTTHGQNSFFRLRHDRHTR